MRKLLCVGRVTPTGTTVCLHPGEWQDMHVVLDELESGVRDPIVVLSDEDLDRLDDEWVGEFHPDIQ